MVNFNEGFSINSIRETGELIDFGVNILLDVPKEIIIAIGISSKSCSYLFADIKIGNCRASFELSENYLLVWLCYDDLVLL